MEIEDVLDSVWDLSPRGDMSTVVVRWPGSGSCSVITLESFIGIANVFSAGGMTVGIASDRASVVVRDDGRPAVIEARLLARGSAEAVLDELAIAEGDGELAAIAERAFVRGAHVDLSAAVSRERADEPTGEDRTIRGMAADAALASGRAEPRTPWGRGLSRSI